MFFRRNLWNIQSVKLQICLVNDIHFTLLCKEGLFGEIERKSTVRKFHEKDIETLRVIQCLKKSGLEIKEIKYFMDLNAKKEKIPMLKEKKFLKSKKRKLFKKSKI